MRNYKTLTLSLLVTLVALTATFVATRSTQSHVAAPEKKTIKVLRKKDQLGVKPTAQEIAAQLPQVERALDDQIPKHLPIKIKVKNLKSEKWVRDFELEITNTSDKPIYHLRMSVSLPDVITENNRNLGFPLRYGRSALNSFSVPIEPDDVPIKPGESYTLKIPEQLQLGWESLVKRRGLAKEEPRKIKFTFQNLNFGDGTGFRFPSGIPFNIHQRRRELMQRESERKTLNASLFDPPPRSSDQSPLSSTLFLPATFLPVNFSPAKTSEPASGGTMSSSDICCPGSSCQSLREEIVYCCAEIIKAVNSPCSDPAGSCTTYTTEDVSCYDKYGTYCIQDILNDPCPPPRPNTSPTPNTSPSPSPSPSATPTSPCGEDCTRCNPSAFCETNFPPVAYCRYPVCLYGPTADFCNYPPIGCPNNAYYDGGGCCKCVNENPTCPDGYYWNADQCECVAAPSPLPSATPTPAGGGYQTYSVCTEFYWVTYESYDDGQTWYEVERDYVGCW
jgi:hypothetical protein